MSGSLKLFAYLLDSGLKIHVKLDESVTEAINTVIPAFVVGSPVFNGGSKLRYALYSSADGLTKVKGVVLQTANIATLPASFEHTTVDAAGVANAVTVFISTTRGEKFPRATPVDTGKNDGDQP